MTRTDLRAQLLGNPQYALRFILANNPVDVAEKLRASGIVVSNEQDMEAALLGMLERGDKNGFIDALSVPVDLTNLDTDSAAVLADVSRTMARAQADRSGYKNAQSTEVDWTDVFRGIAAGLSVALAPDAPPAGGGTAPAPAPAPSPAAKSNTMLWVFGAIAVAALIVVLVVVAKKKAK